MKIRPIHVSSLIFLGVGLLIGFLFGSRVRSPASDGLPVLPESVCGKIRSSQPVLNELLEKGFGPDLNRPDHYRPGSVEVAKVLNEIANAGRMPIVWFESIRNIASFNEQALEADRLAHLERVPVDIERKNVYLRWGIINNSTNRLRSAVQRDCGVRFG